MLIDLPQPTAVPVDVDPRRSALVIVDMENEFLKPGGLWYIGQDRAEAVIATARQLRERVRAAGAPVIYVRSVRTLESPEHTVYGLPHHLIEGSWGAEYVDELRPEPGATIVKKHTHDAFYNTAMDATLARLGIRPLEHQVIVCGVAAGGCVYLAVAGFHLRNYWTVIPVDCVSGGSPIDVPWALYRWSHPAYRYNIALTTLDLLTFVPVEAEAPVP